MISRRGFLKLALGALASGAGLAAYAFGVEPLLRLRAARHRVQPKNWPPALKLKIAVIADLHACRPWMTPEHIRRIVDETNALGADLIALLGDYHSCTRFSSSEVSYQEWAQELSRLRAPIGVHSVLGNHDWWADSAAQRRRKGPVAAGQALKKVGIPVYENDVVRLTKGGETFWLAGLGDQIALRHPGTPGVFDGVDDLPGTLAKVSDEAPIILLAHEPDIFTQVPARVACTISGHTHGGQVRLFGYSPIVPSDYGNRFAYGHVTETGSHLVVSGGLGCSILPVRFGVPPEITVIDLGAAKV